ncbi:MAG TPA: ABC transporter substrate-binding protein [Solirubrobacterales bacterium]|nr:ABC transporter substrate-binding protein [Solirubrobacterales bacterium]
MELERSARSGARVAAPRGGRALLAALAVVVIALSLTACGSSSGGSGDGVLRATFSSFPDYLDPALSHSEEGWTAIYNTYVPLLTYRHADGKAGSEVIPGLARSLPEISADGLTYRFRLRDGLRYSDGEPVVASDFERAVERVFLLNSSGSPFYTDIVGAAEFAKSKQGGISGITTDDESGEITIELVRPRGTFLQELALPFTAPLPAGTPDEDLSADPPPATGPYEIVSSKPGRGWSYDRNPYWAKANEKAMPQLPSGYVDKIEVTVLRNPQSQVEDVEAGRYDWMENPPPADRYAEVKDTYEGTQFRTEATESTYFFWMNTTEPPFDDVRVRQAVNYAVDPEALERIYAGQIVPTQQILPPGMPGYKRFELYPYDREKARTMVDEADPADRQITVWTDSERSQEEAGAYLAEVLKDIGFEAKLQVLNADNYFTIIGNQSTQNLDIGWASWFQDYPHPNDFFQPLLSEASIFPTNTTNLARFADPKLSAKIEELAEKPLSPPVEAEYADLDRQFMEQAPWVPYGTGTLGTFVSSAIDLDQVIYNPTFNQDLTSFRFK